MKSFCVTYIGQFYEDYNVQAKTAQEALEIARERMIDKDFDDRTESETCELHNVEEVES